MTETEVMMGIVLYTIIELFLPSINPLFFPDSKVKAISLNAVLKKLILFIWLFIIHILLSQNIILIYKVNWMKFRNPVHRYHIKNHVHQKDLTAPLICQVFPVCIISGNITYYFVNNFFFLAITTLWITRNRQSIAAIVIPVHHA